MKTEAPGQEAVFQAQHIPMRVVIRLTAGSFLCVLILSIVIAWVGNSPATQWLVALMAAIPVVGFLLGALWANHSYIYQLTTQGIRVTRVNTWFWTQRTPEVTRLYPWDGITDYEAFTRPHERGYRSLHIRLDDTHLRPLYIYPARRREQAAFNAFVESFFSHLYQASQMGAHVTASRLRQHWLDALPVRVLAVLMVLAQPVLLTITLLAEYSDTDIWRMLYLQLLLVGPTYFIIRRSLRGKKYVKEVPHY